MTDHMHEPLTEETLRLVSSVQDWARRSFPADAERQASDCQWCPLCQFVAALRGERPEVTARVAEAGTAVVTALRAVLDAAADASNRSGAPRHADAGRPAPARQERPRVQRIDLSDES